MPKLTVPKNHYFMFYKPSFYSLHCTQNSPVPPQLVPYEYVLRNNHSILDDVHEPISLSGKEISKYIFISLGLRRELVEKH